MSLLELNDITASYGPTQALFGVDLSLEAGEVCALMGRNGMGKSSTIKVMAVGCALTGATSRACPVSAPRRPGWVWCPRVGAVSRR